MLQGEIRIRVAAIIVEEGQVLLVEHEKDGQSYWLLPGGGVDYGEAMGEALVRELQEELCLEILVDEPLLLSDSIDPRGSRHVVQIAFRAMRQYTDGEISLGDDPRIVDWAFKPISEVASLAMYPDIAEALGELLQNDTASAQYLGDVWKV